MISIIISVPCKSASISIISPTGGEVHCQCMVFATHTLEADETYMTAQLVVLDPKGNIYTTINANYDGTSWGAYWYSHTGVDGNYSLKMRLFYLKNGFPANVFSLPVVVNVKCVNRLSKTDSSAIITSSPTTIKKGTPYTLVSNHELGWIKNCTCFPLDIRFAIANKETQNDQTTTLYDQILYESISHTGVAKSGTKLCTSSFRSGLYTGVFAFNAQTYANNDPSNLTIAASAPAKTFTVTP